jgi:NADH-quinone oxidoreductase subunit N
MRDEHISEYYALLAAAGAGMCFLVTANNLMTLFLGLAWFSISLYILCAIDRELEGSLEAGLKYLIIGGVGSAILLFGSALVYGATGKLAFNQISAAIDAQHLTGDALLVTGLAMILVGLGFKARPRRSTCGRPTSTRALPRRSPGSWRPRPRPPPWS